MESHLITIAPENTNAEYEVQLGERGTFNFSFEPYYALWFLDVSSSPPTFLGGGEQIDSIGYTYQAKKAGDSDTVDGMHADEFLDISVNTQTKSGGLNINGNVGIGTTSPTEALEVSGNVMATNFIGDGSSLTGVVTTETDPTVNASVKDGVDWSEVANRPTGLDDGDDIGITTETDPKVGNILINSIPKWNGSQLVDSSSIYEDTNGNVGIGTTSPGVKLDVQGKIRSLVNGTEFYMVPKGAIIMWSGSLASIPDGWALCDGTYGTPDLRDRFVVGAASGSDPGTTGGASSYNLATSQLPSHTHTGSTNSTGDHSHSGSTSTNGEHTHRLKTWPNIPTITEDHPYPASINWTGAYFETEFIQSAGSHSHSLNINSAGSHTHSFTTNATGSGAYIDNRPAYYALAFIMRL